MDLTGPLLPWCRLRSLITHLPLDSAFRRETDTDRVGDWGIAEQLLAQVIHRLELAMYQQADEKKRGQPPDPMPMPWDDKPEPLFTDEDLVAQPRHNAAEVRPNS